MDFDKKTLFSELDKDIKKHAKKNDKKHKEKKGKIKSNDPFGYGFDPDDFNKKKKKDKNKEKDSDKKKDKKHKVKKIKPESDYTKVDLGSGKLAKKVLKTIKSKELQESFKKDKVLIDNKKFWTKD